MDYFRHYNLLIYKARNRTVSGYVERHHIIPRCMNGSDDPTNIVSLTPEEHFLAHLLLVRIHPQNQSLIYAALMMSKNGGRNNKAYGWLRRRLSILGLSEQHKKRIGDANRGRKQTPEHIRKRIDSIARTVSRKQPRKTKGKESRKLIKDMTLDELYAYWAQQEEKRKRKKETADITALLYSLI
jgi:hypothetical protein